MSNIMINKNCNLNCPYCFANEFVNKEKNENTITVENFKKAIDFIAEKDSKVGIIGGEPTIHPEFEKLIDIAINDCRINKVTVYTNGINIDKYERVLSKRGVSMLINLNSPNDIGLKNYNKIIENINRYYNKYGLDNVTFGINMYKTDFDYEYMIKALDKFNINVVRTSIAVPNNVNSRDFDMIEYFKSMKPRVFEFFKKLGEMGIMPFYDCNAMPLCVLTDEEREWLKTFVKYERKCNCVCNLVDPATCFPVIDILPDLTSVRCFGCSEQSKIKISNFSNTNDLSNFFVHEIDSYATVLPTHPQCKDCYYKHTKQCSGGCLAYKQKMILKLKNMCNDLIEGDVKK